MDPQGNIFVSDGYINSRVAMFDKNGNIIGSFGEPGTGQGQFNTPHTIAIDAQDNIYVGDRGNGRIQVFDNSGKFLRIINQTEDVTLPKDIHAIRQPRRPAPGAAAGQQDHRSGRALGDLHQPAQQGRRAVPVLVGFLSGPHLQDEAGRHGGRHHRRRRQAAGPFRRHPRTGLPDRELCSTRPRN